MCTSQRPENGADSYIDRADQSCDLCGKVIYDGSLRAETLAGSTLWRCGACRARADEHYRRMTGDAA